MTDNCRVYKCSEGSPSKDEDPIDRNITTPPMIPPNLSEPIDGSKDGDDTRGNVGVCMKLRNLSISDEAQTDQNSSENSPVIPCAGVTDEPMNFDECNLFVGDLARGLTEEELEAAFSQFGGVMTVNIKRDRSTGKNLGYGFIRMSSHSEAEKAKSEMHKFELRGRRVRVGWAQKNTSLYVGNLHEDITIEDIKTVFGQFGELDEEHTFVMSGGKYGLVKFRNRVHSEEARRQLNGAKVFGNYQIKVDWNILPSNNGGSISKFSNLRQGRDNILPNGYNVNVSLECDEGLDLKGLEHLIQDIFKDYLPLTEIFIFREDKSKDQFSSAKDNLEYSETSSNSSADAGAGSTIRRNNSETNLSSENCIGLLKGEDSPAKNDDLLRRVNCSIRFPPTNQGQSKAINAVNHLNNTIHFTNIKVICSMHRNDHRLPHSGGLPFIRSVQSINSSPILDHHFSGSGMWANQSPNPPIIRNMRQRAPYDGVVLRDEVQKPGKNILGLGPNQRGRMHSVGNIMQQNSYIAQQMPPFTAYQYNNYPIPMMDAHPEGYFPGCYPMPYGVVPSFQGIPVPLMQGEQIMPIPSNQFAPPQYPPGNYWYGNISMQGQQVATPYLQQQHMGQNNSDFRSHQQRSLQHFNNIGSVSSSTVSDETRAVNEHKK
mmetsp:Transcript_17173/g.25428  ORF Transcript_17173/g.25428 Transcript_17173/m.25428 type:complete len:655 (-) Transcript_17173:221-2185(-)|eukprot:CAMPEP_0171454306 /NCGR_PEP_ID=MMETSP0945-20130129/1645_1 /TAXON_ID=109269 /ORGANISM="Vaucheria litorea, Strain CCMP2940" /LENGTH=654 /DNA_ID=CAMNT_0011979303 /DNA_START=117 /DNA_END=2081 /DNA_ORIENTATION=+